MADSAQPERVETAERLLCLVHCDSEEEILRGTESRTLLDNWFRVEFQLALINDWIPDDPIVDRGVAVAAGGVRAASD